MDDLLSEKEQIEQIRNWWSEYGWFVIGGVALGVALLVGWNWYQGERLAAQQEASTRYEALTNHVVDGELAEAEAIVEDLATNFADTAYLAQSQIAIARLYMDQNRDQDAADALQAVIDSGVGDELRHVARLRLARIYLYQDKAQDAIDLIDAQEESAFSAAYNEVIGDAQLALGNIAAAQDAYQAVLADPDAQNTVDLRLVQWKLLDLPEVAPVVDLPTDAADTDATMDAAADGESGEEAE